MTQIMINNMVKDMDISRRVDVYKPDKDAEKLIKYVLDDVDMMIEQQNKTWIQFNDITRKAFLDDAMLRLNAHVVSKEAQGKEEWQANVALPTIRDKTKKMLAGFSMTIPELTMKAFSEDFTLDVNRSDIAKELVLGSYLQEENPILENYWEAWHCATEGTVVKYEGYLKTQIKQKHITSYDIVTGEIEFEEFDVNVDDKCISYLMPLSEFFIRDFTINNVQEQPSVAWIRYQDKSVFDYEFKKYANWKYVKTKGEILGSRVDTGTAYYDKRWMDRVRGETTVEVIKWYSKMIDAYVIIANGVLLLDAPLLWEVNGIKVYPFAKTIWEAFTGKHFFYGNPLANTLMGQYDILNTLFNSVLDKEFRAITPFLLVGRINQDAFDLEDDILTLTTKITVDDVNQVKDLKLEGPNATDLAMIEMIARGLDNSAPSVPDMLSGKNATAREVVIAEERLKDIKTVHQEMLADLWRQKYALRLSNIILNYPQPRKIIKNDPQTGKPKANLYYRTYIVNDTVLDKNTGERGMLAIKFQPINKADVKGMEEQIAVEEEMMKQQGINLKKLILPPDYLDGFIFQQDVIPESLNKSSLARKQSVVQEKLETYSKFFPQIFIANQQEYFKEVAESYDEKPDTALRKFNQIQDARMQAAAAQAEGGQGAGGAPIEGQPQLDEASIINGGAQQ